MKGGNVLKLKADESNEYRHSVQFKTEEGKKGCGVGIVALVWSKEEKKKSPSLLLLPTFFLTLCFSTSSFVLLLTMWVLAACCHGYSWSLMHSVTFLRDRLTLGAVFVWARLRECVGGILCTADGEMFSRTWRTPLPPLADWWMSLLFLLCVRTCARVSLRPPAASWRLWNSTWPLWRARRQRSWMRTRGTHFSPRLDSHGSKTSCIFHWFFCCFFPFSPPVLQSVHLVKCRLISVLHRHVLQPHGWEGEAAGPGGGAGQAAGSQGKQAVGDWGPITFQGAGWSVRWSGQEALSRRSSTDGSVLSQVTSSGVFGVSSLSSAQLLLNPVLTYTWFCLKWILYMYIKLKSSLKKTEL